MEIYSEYMRDRQGHSDSAGKNLGAMTSELLVILQIGQGNGIEGTVNIPSVF